MIAMAEKMTPTAPEAEVPSWLHLIGKRPLAWQQLLALNIGIDHHQHGGIIV